MEIRKAQRGDEQAIMELIHGLAVYENEPDAVVNTAEALGRHLFDEHLCEAFVANVNGTTIGFALFFTAYSTWKGPIVYLEDLFVLPEHRGTGAGSALFDAVVEVARERKCPRMDWQVLDWNTPAIDFYKRKGATIDTDWYNGRIFFPEHSEH